MEFEETESPEQYWDDLEEFERNQVAEDISRERDNEETPLGRQIEESGETLDE